MIKGWASLHMPILTCLSVILHRKNLFAGPPARFPGSLKCGIVHFFGSPGNGRMACSACLRAFRAVCSLLECALLLRLGFEAEITLLRREKEFTHGQHLGSRRLAIHCGTC